MKHLIILASFCTLFFACKKENTLFQRIKGNETGITFNNQITENDTLNILKTEFIYNGGGVAIGDLNGDGLQDLFYTGNQVDNKCYLNKGNLQFEDITDKAGLAKPNKEQWSSGINILDINLDGKPDIYVCNTFRGNPILRRNLLYINQGNDAAGYPSFKELANEYGLDSDTHSPNAQFFDYDNDGDFDVFLSINFMDRPNPNAYREKKTDGSDPNCDKLLRNDWDTNLGHPVFTDVSLSAGLIHDGYSHSALVSDFNKDGWLDIYVANDYVTNDLMYINNQNGTFTNRIAATMKHQAASAMGSDIADINNDGLLDIFTTEMLPYYNKRKKLFLGPNNYAVYKNNEQYNYEYQYGRNVMQLNQGLNSETGLPIYSDVSFLTGLQETEWSWTPLMADYDNDGDRDLFITNGFPRDVTDHDFGNYHASYGNLITPMDLQDMIPQIKVPKFMFRNEGNLQFSDQSKSWGVAIPAFSNGAAYGDLDNDGDLDLVVNNINDEAFFFKNTLNDNKEQKPNFVRINVENDKPGLPALGAEATVFFNGQQQTATVLSARGYNAASETTLHFGLGAATSIDSIKVRWPGNKSVVLTQVTINQTLTITSKDASNMNKLAASPSYFKALNTKDLGLDYIQTDDDFVDFDHQRTLPHKFSEFGPGLAVGDINGDGLDDIFQGGVGSVEGMFFIQNVNGTFSKQPAAFKTNTRKLEEDLGVLLFDADGDGDNDLFATRGGAQNPKDNEMYQDFLYINDGKGHFTASTTAIPTETTSGLAAKAADYDGDGDLDLFIGGSMVPRAYPNPDRSFILRNDTQGKDQPRFTDVTAQVCPELVNYGLINDALWSDYDNDGRIDLILAAEWMPLSYFHNEGNIFKNKTADTGISDQIGWWNSLTSADFDNDGDMDYVAGNYGKNLYFQCHSNEPITLYAKDFDNNGSMDPFISCFWQDSLGKHNEYFYHTRDDMIKQLILIRRKFFGYGDYGMATVQQVFNQQELEGAIIKKTNQLASCFIENLGGGKFKYQELPVQAQLAPIFGMIPYDIDHDGLIDLMMTGNAFGMELLQGRADAFNGLVLKNLGKNQFRALSLQESNFFVPRNARALVHMRMENGNDLVLATQNRDDMRVFAPNNKEKSTLIRCTPNEVKAKITLRNGQTRLQELYWGQGFLSQQQRALIMDNTVEKMEILDGKNKTTRTIGGNVN